MPNKRRLIDLHMHSTYSDGRLTPRELVDMAAGLGLAAVALADHDCLDGVPEYREAAAGAGLESVTAVELSCIHRGRDLHILGYGIDVEDRTLQEMLKRFRDTRENRGMLIVEKLAGLGIHLDAGKILERAGDGALGRPHIAEALVEGGYAKDFSEVFDKYLGEHCPAYVEKYKMNAGEAVRYIHGASGLAFVAHPGFYLDDMDGFDELLEEAFDGIEVYHSQHNPETAERLVRIARDRGLLMSGGSDYHGFEGRDSLGRPPVPYEFFARITERLGDRAA
jgi:predicted metal-dependent phosphoesterase TrpH